MLSNEGFAKPLMKRVFKYNLMLQNYISVAKVIKEVKYRSKNKTTSIYHKIYKIIIN